MIKHNLEFKQQIVTKLLKGRINTKEAVDLLGCKRLTVYRYRNKVTKGGLDALKDARHSNNIKLGSKQLLEVIQKKKDGSWRSARKALELTNIQTVSVRRVRPDPDFWNTLFDSLFHIYNKLLELGFTPIIPGVVKNKENGTIIK